MGGTMARKLVIVGLCSLAVALTLLIAHARRPAESTSFKEEPIGEKPSSPSKLEAEILVLRPDGFQPREIRRPPGRFLLALQNQSKAEELSLTLTPEGGNPLRQVRFENKQSKLREVLELTPGRYVLTEANHPEWTCSIEILSH
jgi:hypothetical protein